MSLQSTITYRAITDETASAEILAAVALKSIVVTGMIISADAASSVVFKSDDGSGASISSTLYLAAGSTMSLPPNYDGWFSTVAGEALYATISITGNMSFMFTYRLV